MQTKAILKVLMERDGYEREEAVAILKDVAADVRRAIEAGNFCEAEEIFMEELGLEPDYMF